MTTVRFDSKHGRGSFQRFTFFAFIGFIMVLITFRPTPQSHAFVVCDLPSFDIVLLEEVSKLLGYVFDIEIDSFTNFDKLILADHLEKSKPAADRL